MYYSKYFVWKGLISGIGGHVPGLVASYTAPHQVWSL